MFPVGPASLPVDLKESGRPDTAAVGALLAAPIFPALEMSMNDRGAEQAIGNPLSCKKGVRARL